jgi:metallophosphoesterase (TIGR00282 family)
VVNAENAAGGRGLTPAAAREIVGLGVDVITLGNHTWDRPEVDNLWVEGNVLRPANYPPGLPGKGWGVFRKDGVSLAVIQVMGRRNLADIDCPFRAADALVKSLPADILLVEMHAEATSEKQALGWYLAGRVAAVVGTHSHVQTADARVLPGGTAFITDAGMTGPRDGVIGGKRDAAIERFLTGLHRRAEVAVEGDLQFNGLLVDVDESTGRARSVERLFEVFERTPSPAS